MPILKSAGPDGITISDSLGVVFEGGTGDLGHETKIRNLVGTIKIKDVQRQHQIIGAFKTITLPLTGIDAWASIPNTLLSDGSEVAGAGLGLITGAVAGYLIRPKKPLIPILIGAVSGAGVGYGVGYAVAVKR